MDNVSVPVMDRSAQSSIGSIDSATQALDQLGPFARFPSPASNIDQSAVQGSSIGQRCRRRKAGQSGGQFEIVQRVGGLSYRYVWPNQEVRFVDRLLSVMREPLSGTLNTTIPADANTSSREAEQDLSCFIEGRERSPICIEDEG